MIPDSVIEQLPGNWKNRPYTLIGVQYEGLLRVMHRADKQVGLSISNTILPLGDGDIMSKSSLGHAGRAENLNNRLIGRPYILQGKSGK
jgi:hypothetical protein